MTRAALRRVVPGALLALAGVSLLGATTGSGRVAAAVEATVVPPPVTLELVGRGSAITIIPVGVDPSGELQVPDDPMIVGWWAAGAAPGAARGNVVIAGHVDSHRFGIGAFAALWDSADGDVVRITDSLGEVHEYVVTERHQQPKAELDAQWFAADAEPQLVLITCIGDFDEERRRYSDNLVVIAEPTR